MMWIDSEINKNPKTAAAVQKAVNEMNNEHVAKHPRQGHPRFYELTKAEEVLHERKNAGYAGKGDPLGNFVRVARIYELYPGLDLTDSRVVLLTYVMKHIDALLFAFSPQADAVRREQTVEESCGDISVYMKLIRCLQHYEPKNLNESAL